MNKFSLSASYKMYREQYGEYTNIYVRVEKVRYLAFSNLMNYLVYKFYFQELLCVAWRQQQHMIRPHRSLLFTRRLIQRVNGGLEIVCSKLCYIWMHFKDLVRKDT